MLDLWLEAQQFAAKHDISMVLPKMVSPSQLYGIETEFYAHELASIVVWIGFLQWKYEHAIHDDREPILQKLNNIEHADAILRYDPEGQPYEPQWPHADYIIGNPPFLGGKLLRRELGDTYVDDLFALYKGEVRAESDLVVYWFEKARRQLAAGHVQRVGLIATQAIRGGANRAALERIQQTGTIFWAWADRPWLLQGAAVHVSMVAFQSTDRDGAKTVETGTTLSASGATIYQPGAQPQVDAPKEPQSAEGATYSLDGKPVPFINPDLTTGSNSTSAIRLNENIGLSFIGDQKGGKFDIDPIEAASLLAKPVNPNGKTNEMVVRPWINGADITGRPRNLWIIDFGSEMSHEEAALFEAPFERIKRDVYPERQNNRRDSRRTKWWLHHEPMPAMRSAIRPLNRYIATPRVSKHRVFVWVTPNTLADSAVTAITRQDDYFFGVLHSSIHELWARAQGTQLREVESGFRYTPNSTFDTFPFPYPPGTEPSEADSPIVRAIADAARELVRLRDAWLNPKDDAGQPLPESELKDRTLTKLYNARPAWLANAHRTLDRAVFAAYGWPYEVDGKPLSDQEILSRLLALNHERAAAQAK